MRCNSSSHLYPVSSRSGPSAATSIACLSIPAELWHNRLGHPGDPVFSHLRTNKLIQCNKILSSSCNSCQLGKHLKLPFASSLSTTSQPFDLIHSDLWTSPVLSSTG
ncbi:unnamed protein product, partial [Cuscuta epithymum]